MTGTVRISVPAAPPFAAVVRTVAMTMAAQASLDGERVQDARLLVDEIFNYLLTLTDQPTDIDYEFRADTTCLHVRASLPLSEGAIPELSPTQSRILHTLTSELSTHHVDEMFFVSASIGCHV